MRKGILSAWSQCWPWPACRPAAADNGIYIGASVG